MSVPQSSIEAALIDVRKAYRLLHDYQRAALDAAKYIGAQLGLTYAGGFSRFSSSAPKDGKGDLENWAWDWLNLMFYEFYFESQKGKKPYLTIWLFSDTGYFLTGGPEEDKRPVSGFAPVEDSGTKVGFCVYRDWKESYENIYTNRDVMRRFLQNNGELPEEMRRGGVVGKCCDFARLRDEVSTDAVVTELIDLATSADLPLRRVKKAGGA